MKLEYPLFNKIIMNNYDNPLLPLKKTIFILAFSRIARFYKTFLISEFHEIVEKDQMCREFFQV